MLVLETSPECLCLQGNLSQPCGARLGLVPPLCPPANQEFPFLLSI